MAYSADIKVTVKKFRPISLIAFGLCCDIDDLVISGDPAHKVSLDVANKKLLLVKKGQIDLNFVINPASDYIPAGIAFESTIDPNGSGNFGPVAISGSTITVTNKYTIGKPHGGGPSPHWNFSILIQKLSTQELGLIDPGIENEEEAVFVPRRRPARAGTKKSAKSPTEKVRKPRRK